MTYQRIGLSQQEQVSKIISNLIFMFFNNLFLFQLFLAQIFNFTVRRQDNTSTSRGNNMASQSGTYTWTSNSQKTPYTKTRINHNQFKQYKINSQTQKLSVIWLKGHRLTQFLLTMMLSQRTLLITKRQWNSSKVKC